jgi:tetratricopeptide (TPR) repeat protein
MPDVAPIVSPASPCHLPSTGFRYSILGIIVLSILVIYGRALTFEFVPFDDDINVYKNEHIQKLDGSSLRWMFTNTQAALRYKPLSWLAWAVVHSAFGLDPIGYHLINILLHCVNALLVFVFLHALFATENEESTSRTARLFGSAWAALFWALHPLRVEPVAWVTGLPYGLSVCFLLLSVLFHLRAKAAQSIAKPTWGCYWASVGFFLLSALSYPVGLMYPFVLLLLDTYLFDRQRLKKNEAFSLQKLSRVWLEKTPYVIITFLFIVITLRGRIEAQGIWPKPVALTDFGVVPRAMQAFYIWAYYVWKSFLPLGLSPLYTILCDFDPWSWPFVTSAAFVLGFTCLMIWKRSRWQFLLALWVSYLVLLVPVLGLTEHPHFPSDRYGFLASIIWSILLLGLVLKLVDSRINTRRPMLFAGVASLILLATMSFQQTAIWRDGISLFEQMAQHNPNAPRVLEFLASQYKAKNEPDKALECYARLVRDNPKNLAAQEAMGTLLFEKGRYEEAAKHYSILIEMDPQNAQFHNDLGVIFAASGSLRQAVQQFEAALRIQPNFVSANRNLAKALAQEGRPNDAEAVSKKAATGLGQASKPESSL